MYKDRSKSGGKSRSPVADEKAAVFRSFCQRFSINLANCNERLGISKSTYYDYGNGDREIPKTVWLLINSIEAYDKLQKAMREMEDDREKPSAV